MKNEVVLFFTITVFTFGSCQKQKSENGFGTTVFSEINNELKQAPDLKICFSATDLNGVPDQPTCEVNLYAYPLKSLNQFAELTVNGKTSPRNNTPYGGIFSTNKPRGSLDTREDLSGLFGKDVDISFKSQELGNFNGTLTTTLPIHALVNDKEVTTETMTTEVSKSNDLKITWNKDESNKLPVVFHLRHEKAFPDIKNGEQPFDPNIFLKKEGVDNGILIIKSSELQKFPEGDYINISIFRSSYKILTTSLGKKALLYTLNQSGTPHLLALKK